MKIKIIANLEYYLMVESDDYVLMDIDIFDSYINSSSVFGVVVWTFLRNHPEDYEYITICKDITTVNCIFAILNPLFIHNKNLKYYKSLKYIYETRRGRVKENI